MRKRGASEGIVSGGWFDSSVWWSGAVECGGLLASSFCGEVETFPVRQPFLRWSGFIESGPAKIRSVARSNVSAQTRGPKARVVCGGWLACFWISYRCLRIVSGIETTKMSATTASERVKDSEPEVPTNQVGWVVSGSTTARIATPESRCLRRIAEVEIQKNTRPRKIPPRARRKSKVFVIPK